MSTHIEEFAGKLRELKERSGRSYGMLAARLHVSTSTLHRYCNGAAVPGDYAPVERFARQCGATGEELVSLHQRWLLADAARRTEPNRTAPGLSEAPDLPEKPGLSDAPDLPEKPGLSDAPDLPDVADTPVAGGKRTARWPRRTKVVLGAAAAIAAVLPLVLRTGHGADNTRASTPLPHVTATAPARPSAPASASGRKPTPTAPAATATAPATPTAPGKAVGSTKPPVQVTVLSDNWDTQCDQWFLLQQQPGKVPPPPSLQQTNAWGAALGGIPARDLRLQLTVQGLPGEPVVLHALYVKVVSSAAAPKGNGYTPGSGCGGGIEPASFAVDLDTTVPRARAVAGYVGNDQKAAVADFPFQVSARDAQVIDVDAHTLDHDVSWYLDLVWTCGGRQGTLRIDDNGAPFRTVGLKDDPTYFYDGTTWSPSSPQN